METTESAEKRKFKRVEFRESVQYRLSENSITEGSLGYDISEGGVKITLNKFLPLKTPVQLDTRLANQPLVQVNGEIAWINQLPHSERFQAGVRFTETSPFNQPRNAIQKFVNSLRI